MSFENNNLQTEAESILVKKVKDVHGFLETFINNEFLETFHPVSYTHLTLPTKA